MSYEAVYTVTRALQKLLHTGLAGPARQEAVVTLLPPGDTLPDTLGVNLYLYRVLESPYTKNQPWPGDRATPPSRETALGLQLFYLLTPLGARPEQSNLDGDHAHTTLGQAMLTLHEHPILNDVHIPGFDADADLPQYLQESYERITVRLAPAGLDELSKIWSTINKPYRLSVAYEVSLVELTPTPPPPIRSGIVTSTGVTVVAPAPPRLTALAPSGGALGQVDGDVIRPNALEIRGFGLSVPGETPVVRIGGQPAKIRREPKPRDEALTVDLPTSLDAGPQADVRVTLRGQTSTPLVFTVSPWLADLTPIRLAPDPAAFAPYLTLHGSGFPTASPPTVRFERPGVSPLTMDVESEVTGTLAIVAIPGALASADATFNGIYSVRLVGDDGSVSNARTVEIMPFIHPQPVVERIDIPEDQPTRSVHRLTIEGARLNGRDVRIVLDGVEYVTENKHLTPGELVWTLVYTFERLLARGAHTLAVTVDGHLSHSVELEAP